MEGLYSINIKNIRKDKNLSPVSGLIADVDFIDKNNQVIVSKTLPYYNFKELTNLIDKKHDINLDNSLVIDFNLNNYRKIKELKETKFITFRSFSAQNTVFFSKEKISFHGANFIGEYADFQKATFIAPEGDFSKASFEKSEENFHATVFKTDYLSFKNASFGEQKEHDFKNAKFSGKKDFEAISFKKGEVNFSGVDFGQGDINFTNAYFGNGRTLFRMSVFGTGKKDFTRVNFGSGELSFEKVEFSDGDVSFRSVTFPNAKKDFRRCSFGKGKKNFANANFGNGTLDFVGTDFGKGKVSFKLASFGKGDKDFHYCHFGDGDIQFDKTYFGDGIIDFRAVDFDNCRVIFNHIEINNGDVIFEASQMVSGFISFKNSVLGRGSFNFENAFYPNADLIIQNVDFGQGIVSLRLSKFNNIILKASQINNYFDLRISKCKHLDLSNTVIKDVIDLQAPSHQIDIQSIDFSGVRLLGRIYIDWYVLNVKKLILQQDTSWRNKADQFRMLKENFHSLGMYQEEDLAYVEFKRCEEKAILEEKQQKGKLNLAFYYPIHWGKILILDKIGRYATDPIRVLLSMLIVYLSFTALYLILELVSNVPQIISSLFEPGDPRILGDIAKAFYHSAITFLTIGYGDYYPNGISRWISSLEGFIGLFMMSYFTVAFVRKILR